MAIHPLWLILFVLIAIIPSLVVAVVFLTRFEALRGDVSTKKVEIDGVISSFRKDIEGITTRSKTAREAFEIADRCNMKLMNLEESFTALSNKWNSREAERKRAQKRSQPRKEELEEDDEYEEIPGTQQQILPMDQLPPFPPQPQQQGNVIVKPSRKFGSLPG